MSLPSYLIQVYETVDETAIREMIQKARTGEEAEMMSIFAREMMAKGAREGERIGELKGELKGEAKLLLRQLTRRFGDLSAWDREQVDTADMATLEAWGDRILEARSLEEVFGPNPVH